MILIITHKEDYTADFLINKLNQQNLPYYRFNCEDIDSYNYLLDSKLDLNFWIDSNMGYRAVWYRRIKLPILKNLSKHEYAYLIGEYEALLSNLFCSIDTIKWISDPNFVRIAENKSLQLKIAKDLGFNIPHTLITNDKKRIVSFFSQYQAIIIKPIYSGRVLTHDNPKLIYTNILLESHIRDLVSYDITPCIFQEYIEKDYEIRVTVVGDEVFAARVNSQSIDTTKIDWRREKLKFEAYILPIAIARLCVQIVNRFKLAFGAIDLIKAQNGEYYFLEINPNGQWAWIEIDTDLPIAASIIDYLYK